MSGDLKFDNIMVQVEEAVMYMNQHNCTFTSIGFESSDQSMNDLYNNKIILANHINKKDSPSFDSELNKNLPDIFMNTLLNEKFNLLVEDIKSKKSLFAEVEYILRNRPIEQTINCDLKLIIQNLMHVSLSPQHKFYKSNVLVMRENSPLATLGFVAQMLCAHNEVIIQSVANTAVACHIFTTMCHKAGLNNVKLAFLENPQQEANDVTELVELQSGCAAVVTGNGDIDSAVDAIIGAPNFYPWHVRRVFVQECIGKRFRQALGWKSGLQGPEADGFKEYAVNGKLFLHECIDHREGVIIEEYRTVKELLSLCKENASFAVSLWCSDASEALEIAHGVSATLVWVNGLWEWSGPPAASQGFYSVLDTAFSTESMLATKVPANSESWLKPNSFEKRDSILRSIKRCDMKLNIHVPENSFAMVDSGILCFGTQLTASSVFSKGEWPVQDILSALVVGSTVFHKDQPGQRAAFYNDLRDAGLQVHAVTSDSGLSIPSIFSMYRTKVVWTTFGTAFAN